jgi:ABC-2 type transport system permease protein
VISGFRYGFLGTTDSNIAVGVVVLLGVNLALGVICYALIRSGWKLKN